MTEDTDYYEGLVEELRKLPSETGWVEFKENKAEPAEIGEYISALSNSAALEGKTKAYLVWGIQNETHEVVGTSFAPSSTKVGNEELENWLLRSVEPKIGFDFVELEIEGEPIVVLEIEPAFRHPVKFRGEEFIRVGSYKKRLKDFPQKERELWRVFDRKPWEVGTAKSHVEAEEVLNLLDYPSYFRMLNLPLPSDRDGILDALVADKLIENDGAGRWNITNLGASYSLPI